MNICIIKYETTLMKFIKCLDHISQPKGPHSIFGSNLCETAGVAMSLLFEIHPKIVSSKTWYMISRMSYQG